MSTTTAKEGLEDFDDEELIGELAERGIYLNEDLADFDDEDLIEELRTRDSYSDDEENLTAIRNALKLNEEEKALQMMRKFLSDKYGVIL